MPVEDIEDLFDVDIEEIALDTSEATDGVVALASIERTITTCAIC